MGRRRLYFLFAPLYALSDISISFRHPSMSPQRPDDLDDDYVPDNLVADDPDDPVSLESDSDEPDFTGLSVDAGPIALPPVGSSSASTDDAAKAKKRKRREKEKEKRLKVPSLHVDPAVYCQFDYPLQRRNAD